MDDSTAVCECVFSLSLDVGMAVSMRFVFDLQKHSLYAVSGVYEGMASQRGDLTMQIGQTTFRLDEVSV